MKTAVGQFVKRLEQFNLIKEGESENELFRQIELEIKEIEKEYILEMAFKSAYHERKWVIERLTYQTYNIDNNEIKDLKESALKHYNQTFKSE